ncbi:MAG TPA: type II toxin-antitoxin system RelE/ParE family toxin [Phycisphaerae bacterium]|nr:type II toxin-antitoxin system RelE/ParE family toxin [Phycisphaerae bacterium]
MIEVLHYVNESGRDMVRHWLDELRDRRAAARIVIRMDRLAEGNFGDWQPLREGVCELRIDYGPGYRVYYAMAGRTCVLLLCGGDKRKQAADIDRAVSYWRDYKRRMEKP